MANDTILWLTNQISLKKVKHFTSLLREMVKKRTNSLQELYQIWFGLTEIHSQKILELKKYQVPDIALMFSMSARVWKRKGCPKESTWTSSFSVCD